MWRDAERRLPAWSTLPGADSARGRAGLRRIGGNAGDDVNHLLITDRFLPHIGGSRLYYYNVLQRLPDGDASFVLTTEEPGQETFDVRAPMRITRCKIRTAQWLRSLRLQALPFYRDLYRQAGRIVAEESIDVVHCGEPLPGGLVGRLLRRIRHTPLLLYVHDEPLGPPTRLQPRLRASLFRSADGVVAACKFAYQRALEIGVSESRLLLAPPGVDCVRFSPGG